jgi:hypothetical protein
MNSLVLPVYHFTIEIPKGEKENKVFNQYLIDNHIGYISGQYQYGRLANGNKTVNFLGFYKVELPHDTLL